MIVVTLSPLNVCNQNAQQLLLLLEMCLSPSFMWQICNWLGNYHVSCTELLELGRHGAQFV